MRQFVLRLGGLLAAACVGGAAPPAEMAVGIDNFSFAPAELVVAAGTTVVWTNHDDIPHTVTGALTDSAGQHLVRSPPLDTDDRFTHRFDRAGRFAYFCSLHAHMQGAVVVK